MKKIAVAGVVLVAAVAIAAIAAAQFSIPSKVPTSGKEVMETGGKIGIETALNKKLKDANCAFKGNTATTTCDLKKIGNELAAVYKGAEQKGYRVEINIQSGPGVLEAKGKKAAKGEPISAYDRTQKVKKDLQSGLGTVVNSWDFNTNTTDTKDNKLALSVKVK